MLCKYTGLKKRKDPDFYDLRDWAKIAAKLRRDDVTGCWVYEGSIHPKGYGNDCTSQFGTINESQVHRITYTMFRGKIPQGLHIDHLCRNRSCGNPYHMEAVTPGENVLRGVGPCAVNARATHCKNGHSLLGDGMYLKKRGGASKSFHRVCRICDNDKQRERYRRSGGREKGRIRQAKRMARLRAQKNSPSSAREIAITS